MVMRIVMSLLSLLLMPLAMVPGVASAEEGLASREPIVRVSGSYTASAPPDRAVVTLGVVTEADTAEDAAKENAAKVAATLKALRKAFGSSAKLETQGYNLSPKYTYPGQRGGERKLVGYVASNNVQVKTKKLDRVGEVIDVATQAGTNQVNQLRFDLEDSEPLRASALREATLRARSKAQAIARALDLRVQKIVSVEETGTAPAPVFRQRSMAMAEADTSTPIEPGTIDVRAQVTLTVEVGP